MRKVILFVLLFVQVMGYAQDRKVLNIVDSTSTIIKYDGRNQIEISMFEENIDKYKLFELMTLKVCWFYDLTQYDTQLKRKVFNESNDGLKLLNELKQKKQNVINSKAYYMIDFKDNDEWYMGYDLKTKQFVFTYRIHELQYSVSPGYISLPFAQIKVNPLIIHKKEKRRIEIIANMSFPLLDQKKALAIEENLDNLTLVIEFKIQSAFLIEYGGVLDSNAPIMKGTAIKTYIIDKETHEIYLSM